MNQAEIDRITEKRALNFRAYTDAEKADLAKRYSKDQLAAIEAGEAAISATDLANQAQLRRDPFVPEYMDDFSRIEPVIDKKIEKLRGEGQDYENATDFYQIPEDQQDFEAIENLSSDNAWIGDWKIVKDENGGEKWQYEGRERELDYFSAQEFEKTPEYQEYMSEKLAGAQGMTREEFVAEAAAEAEAEAKEEEEEEEEDEYSEAEEAKLMEEYDSEETYVPIDYVSHPKYQEIRARREAEGPMRRRHGFGSTEPDREIERIMQGVFPDVAPEIPKITDPAVRWDPVKEDDAVATSDTPGGLEEEALEAFQRVGKAIGQSVDQMLRYKFKTLVNHNVTNQTHLGKIQSVYTLVVAGDTNGMVGLGEGKAIEPPESMRMARLNAIRHMAPILRYEGRTIYGDVVGKSGATVVQLSARRPGFGVRTNSHIFEIARCAGLQDLEARVPRSRNPMNVAKAVWQALKSQKNPEDVARGRGKKLVDVRKVYYNGSHA